MRLLFAILFALCVTSAHAQNINITGPYSNAAIGQLPGTATNDNAAAGNIGQYVESVVVSGSAVPLTTGTQTNITSISLTPGDWDISCTTYFSTTSTTSYTRYAAGISTTSAVIDATPGRYADTSIPATVPNSLPFTSVTGPVRFSISSTTTFFLVALGTFTASTSGVYGTIRARRVR